MKKTITIALSLILAIGCFFTASAEKKLDTDSKTLKLVESFDSTDKFTGSPVVDTANKKEDTGSVSVSVETGAAIVEKIFTDAPIDLSAYGDKDDAYLYFWFYVEDAEAFKNGADGALEFSSNSAWNSQVNRFDLRTLELKNGWNEVYMPLTDIPDHPDPAVGGCDWSKINYFRIYGVSATAQTLKIDGMYMGFESDFNKTDATTANPTDKPSTDPTKPSNPETGSALPMAGIVVAAVSLTAVAALAGMKRRSNAK